MEKKYNMNPRLPRIAHCSLDKNGAMILMAFIMVARGSSFVFSKWLMDDVEPMNVLAVRFCLAFIILAVIFHKKLMLLDKKTFFKGMLLGVVSVLPFSRWHKNTFRRRLQAYLLLLIR